MIRKLAIAVAGVVILAVVLFVGFLIVLVSPEARIVLIGGGASAEAQLDTGTTVRLELAAEGFLTSSIYQRRLVICDFWCAKQWLIPDINRVSPVHLYRRTDGRLMVIDYAWIMEIDEETPSIRQYSKTEQQSAKLSEPDCKGDSASPPPPAGELPPSRYFKDMYYLGKLDVFVISGPVNTAREITEFRFSPYTEHGEYLCAYPKEPG
jgi:hypothetical protein